MKFENTEVFNFKGAFRGMRNPLDSWDKSDSNFYGTSAVKIGHDDLILAQRLIAGGPEHRKFLRQIFVTVDITAPFYWWKEFDTYKVGTVSNSCSTMHKLTSYPITIENFELDDYEPNLIFETGVDDRGDNAFEYRLPIKDIIGTEEDHFYYTETIIGFLESLRLKYLATKDKRYWKELVRWLPEGWLQKRTITMNYENLHSMWSQRHAHKLTEWHSFCKWVETLPYAEELILYGLKSDDN